MIECRLYCVGFCSVSTQLGISFCLLLSSAVSGGINCSLHTADHAAAHFRHLLCGCDGSRTCSVDATAHAPAPWMRRHKHLLRGCDGALHARGGLRGVDRGLPSVRSARGLQGRQELGRMLVCVTDFVLSLGQLLRETSKRGRRWNEECSLSAGAAWCWSVAFDTRCEELITPRGQALQEHA